MVDRTAVATGTAAAVAEIAVLRQKLAAAATRIQVEMGRHKETEVDKDNAFNPFTVVEVGQDQERSNTRRCMAALLRDMNNPVEVGLRTICWLRRGLGSRKRDTISERRCTRP